MNEIWKNIDGYENLYQVSNLGRVKSIEKIDSLGHKRKEKLLKPANKDGYLQVTLHKEGKRKYYLVHRLVADAFIDNPDNLPQVNHINEDKIDNRVDNLEWCSSEYNINYGSRNERTATALSKPIYSVNKTTNEIEYYQSVTDAGRITNIKPSNISRCCSGKRKSTGGYEWYYAS